MFKRTKANVSRETLAFVPRTQPVLYEKMLFAFFTCFPSASTTRKLFCFLSFSGNPCWNFLRLPRFASALLPNATHGFRKASHQFSLLKYTFPCAKMMLYEKMLFAFFTCFPSASTLQESLAPIFFVENLC